MLKALSLTASVLIVLFFGSALAAEKETSEPTQPTSINSLPDEISDLLTPKPDYKYGMKNGPCKVSVTCLSGQSISCSGQTVCYWKGETGGFVECDGNRTTCRSLIE